MTHHRHFLLSALALCAPASLHAQVIGPVDSIVVGDPATRLVETNLDGFPVPGDIAPIFVGLETPSAAGIEIDAAGSFPPGIAFRRALGDPSTPVAIAPGSQLGYLDFRGYSGTQFWNAASLDVVVDGLIPFADGELPPTKIRFSVSDGARTFVPLELRADGSLEIGAISGESYFGPSPLGQPRLFVNTDESDWGAIVAARPAADAAFALRVHTLGETAADYLLGASSGAGSGSFKFSVRGNGDVHVAGDLLVGGSNIGERIVSIEGDVDIVLTGIGMLESDVISLQTDITEVQSSVAEIDARFGDAAGPDSIALGAGSRAISGRTTAIGLNAVATGTSSLVVGDQARGNGSGSSAYGANAVASAASSTAVGSAAIASGSSAVALGARASALRDNALAAGTGALAQATEAVAVGYKAVAIGTAAAAIGSGARATHDGSISLGEGATSTASDQVTLGGSGSSVRVGDLEASTAAQSGPVYVVTADAAGTLGRQAVATAASVSSGVIMQSLVARATFTAAEVTALSGRIDGIDGKIEQLFDLASIGRKEDRRGIAAAFAMTAAPFPSAAGKTSYAANGATYRGELAVSASISHRLRTVYPLAVSAGISHAGGKNTGARVGLSGEF